MHNISCHGVTAFSEQGELRYINRRLTGMHDRGSFNHTGVSKPSEHKAGNIHDEQSTGPCLKVVLKPCKGIEID